MTEIPVSQIVYREDLYPRIKHDPALVQRYAENISVLPPIEVNQHNILIDGWHRWTAHQKVEAATINVIVTETESEIELFALTIQRNSAHGWQMDESSKRKSAIRLYASGTGMNKERIAEVLSVTLRSVTGYLSDIEKQMREERKQKIFDMWMACYSQEEIGEETNLTQPQVKSILDTFIDFGSVSDIYKSRDFTQDSDFALPLYNIWTFSKKTNNVSHFGNSEQRIVDNLLYLYTQPFDIVVDPFAGGGSTIDMCKNRLRRYWASDRKPVVERASEIRTHDLTTDGMPPLNNRWSGVTLTYLDPPYWRQAAGQYSKDAEDLANMPLDVFTKTLADIVKGVSRKQSKGVIALLIQPTQWSADEKQFTDHVSDLVAEVGNKRLTLENRVSCPYSTEQYNPQQVEWAKENKKLLVLTRELIVWRIV